mmetsp:Transcript_34378/g.47900  ORF Transcript_34378/g.47900 Transcript_34378/m.47900 type:complete len:215 (-) Transcript_34378:156-800(-)
MVAAFTPGFTSIAKFEAERGLLRRETASKRYGFPAHFLSLTACSWVIESISAILFSICFYFISGLADGRFAGCMFILIAFMLLNETLGLIAAIISPSFALAILIHTPPIFLMFAVAQRGIEGINDVIKYLNPFSYASIGLLENEGLGAGEFPVGNGETRSLLQEREFTDPEITMNGLGVWENFGALLAIALVSRVCAYRLLLKFHDAGKVTKQK